MAVTPNFSWPTPDDSDAVSQGAAAMRSLGTAIDATVYSQGTAITANGTAITGLEASKVDVAGDTMTGELVAPNVGIGVTLGTADTVALDFGAGDGFVSRQVAGTAVTVTGSGYVEGRTKTVRFVGGTAVASLTVPSEWTFVGQAVGASIGTAVTAVLSVTSFGTAASDAVAAWAEEA